MDEILRGRPLVFAPSRLPGGIDLAGSPVMEGCDTRDGALVENTRLTISGAITRIWGDNVVMPWVVAE